MYGQHLPVAFPIELIGDLLRLEVMTNERDWETAVALMLMFYPRMTDRQSKALWQTLKWSLETWGASLIIQECAWLPPLVHYASEPPPIFQGRDYGASMIALLGQPAGEGHAYDDFVQPPPNSIATTSIGATSSRTRSSATVEPHPWERGSRASFVSTDSTITDHGDEANVDDGPVITNQGQGARAAGDEAMESCPSCRGQPIVYAPDGLTATIFIGTARTTRSIGIQFGDSTLDGETYIRMRTS